MLEIDKEIYNSESDIEQKFVLPLLKYELHYNNEDIKTKDYLQPTEIDKGAGKKIGYYPDYLIYLGGIPVVVIEVKDKSVDASVGYREARLYAAEINKNYPSDVNPVKYVVSTNGDKLIYSLWDSEISALNLNLDDFRDGGKEKENLCLSLKRDSLLLWANEIRGRVFPRKKIKPLSLIGGPSRQTETLPTNSFSSDLAPILRRYFDPDVTAHSREIIEKAYCSSVELTQYNSTLEALLKERVPKQKDVTSIDTTKRRAKKFDAALKNAVDTRREIPDPQILLLGGVGAGKTSFIKRYFEYLIDSDLRSKLHVVSINFNNASDSLEGVEDWICEEIIKELTLQNGEGFLSYENLRRYFAPDLRKLKEPLKDLEEADPTEYAKVVSSKLLEWYEDSQKLCSSIIRFYSGDCDEPVIIVFDNVDRRDRNQQLKIFQTVQWFRNKNRCFAILSLRDETYDAYRNKPPLDAFLKPFAFRIRSPRFINVVKKRLELAIGYLASQTDNNLLYELPNGISITYPATSLGRYLISIYRSIFNPSRRISSILEAISGNDIRKALEIFTEIMISGYFGDDLIFSITEGHRRNIPEWLVIRVLMRTNHRFFTSNHGYLYNVFDIPDASETSNSYLGPEILEYLSSNRKNASSYSIEGYLCVDEIVEYMSSLGYLKEDVIAYLEVFLNKSLIVADHQRNKGIDDRDYVKITASGYYHIRLLTTRSEYLSNVAMDTYYPSHDVAKRISHNREDNRRQSHLRISILKGHLEKEAASLRQLYPGFDKLARSPDAVLQNINKAFDHAKKEGSGKPADK